MESGGNEEASIRTESAVQDSTEDMDEIITKDGVISEEEGDKNKAGLMVVEIEVAIDSNLTETINKDATEEDINNRDKHSVVTCNKDWVDAPLEVEVEDRTTIDDPKEATNMEGMIIQEEEYALAREEVQIETELDGRDLTTIIDNNINVPITTEEMSGMAIIGTQTDCGLDLVKEMRNNNLVVIDVATMGEKGVKNNDNNKMVNKAQLGVGNGSLDEKDSTIIVVNMAMVSMEEAMEKKEEVEATIQQR